MNSAQQQQQHWMFGRRFEPDTRVSVAHADTTRRDTDYQANANTNRNRPSGTSDNETLTRNTEYDYCQSTSTNDQLTDADAVADADADAVAAAESAGRVLGFTLRIKNGKVRRCIACKVCGDDATGYNFGAIVCESCKSFYRRHVNRRTNFRCSGYGKCQLNHQTRRYCAACRLRKCFAVGMRRPSTFEVTEMQVSQGVWTVERRNRRNLLMKRLVQRITSKQPHALETTVNKSNDTSNIVTTATASKHRDSVSSSSRFAERDFSAFREPAALEKSEYEVLYERISAAAKSITDWTACQGEGSLAEEARARARAAACKSPSSWREACTVWLALGKYIGALEHFDELASVSVSVTKTQLERMFAERVLHQINVYSLFTVNADESGWLACDALGERCEARFVHFVECLTRDGVSAHVYTLTFLELVHSLRANFQHDWPLVLLTLCLINLYSPQSATASGSGSGSGWGSGSGSGSGWGSDACDVTRLRAKYERFLECYVRRNCGADYKSRLEFCTQAFPNALDRLVENQKDLLAQLLRRSNASGSKAELVAAFLQPIVSLLVTHFAKR